jgi:predicted TIM-barrel fold metal-dependent hydrolase
MANRLISADDHVDLTHDNIKSFLDPKFHGEYDAALGRFREANKKSMTNESNTRWRAQHGIEGESASSMTTRRGGHLGTAGHTNAEARLNDMDADGVEASVTYCEVSAFRYLYDLKDGWQQATRAFNTALQSFAAPDPKRLLINAQIPIHDIDAAVKEVQWAAAEGIKSLQLPVFPVELGLPDYWDERYDPLFAAISEADLPICCHIGLNTQLEGLARRDPTPQKGIFVPMTALSTAEAFGMWLLTGIFEKFPKLKVVFVEPGIGWVSWWLHICDDMAGRQQYEFPGLKKAPSEYFRRNVFLTYIDEPNVLFHARNNLGVENVMWSSDYPHPVTSFPHSQQIAAQTVEGATPAEAQLILSGNAERVWNL